MQNFHDSTFHRRKPLLYNLASSCDYGDVWFVLLYVFFSLPYLLSRVAVLMSLDILFVLFFVSWCSVCGRHLVIVFVACVFF